MLLALVRFQYPARVLTLAARVLLRPRLAAPQQKDRPLRALVPALRQVRALAQVRALRQVAVRHGHPPQQADYRGQGQDRVAARPVPLWQFPNWFQALLRAWPGPLAGQGRGFVPDRWQPLPAGCLCPDPRRQKRVPLAAPMRGQGWAQYPSLRWPLPADCRDRRWKGGLLAWPVRALR